MKNKAVLSFTMLMLLSGAQFAPSLAQARGHASERNSIPAPGGNYRGVIQCELVAAAYNSSLYPVSIIVYSNVNSPSYGFITMDAYHSDGELEHFAWDAKLHYVRGGLEVTVKSAAEHQINFKSGQRQLLEYSHAFKLKKDQYLCDSK